MIKKIPLTNILSFGPSGEEVKLSDVVVDKLTLKKLSPKPVFSASPWAKRLGNTIENKLKRFSQ